MVFDPLHQFVPEELLEYLLVEQTPTDEVHGVVGTLSKGSTVESLRTSSPRTPLTPGTVSQGSLSRGRG